MLTLFKQSEISKHQIFFLNHKRSFFCKNLLNKILEILRGLLEKTSLGISAAFLNFSYKFLWPKKNGLKGMAHKTAIFLYLNII